MRYVSIDLLRTFAIFVMVVVHFVENLSGSYFVPSGFGAPLFTFLSGVSYSLWVHSQEARGRKDSEISKVTIRRGWFLFGAGFLFNIFVWLPEDTFNWDVLTFIGAALLFLNVVRKLPAPISLLICGLIGVFSPVLREVTDYPTYWINGYFECDLTLPEILLGFLVNGFFPIFPWIVYPVLGFVVGKTMFPITQRQPGTLNRITGIGLMLLMSSALLYCARSLVPQSAQSVWLEGWRMFPASTQYVLGTLGFAMTALALTHRLVDMNLQPAKDQPIAQIASTYSKYSFTIYLLHHIAHIWPLW